VLAMRVFRWLNSVARAYKFQVAGKMKLSSCDKMARATAECG
jgi:hypothetical protein